MSKPEDLPSFDHPPVIEVVCGIQFKSIEALLAPHLGLLWLDYESDYPTCQEVAPLAPVFERFDEPHPIQMELADKPPLPRVWFVHRDENGIIQVQRDRFLHNWKKIRPTDEYPRYETVIRMFKERLKTFDDFLRTRDLGSLEVQQLEMTYVNHVPTDARFASLDDVGRVLPDFAWRSNSTRFLPTPETFLWRDVFALPDHNGRLHVTVRSAARRDDNAPILVLELTARGMPMERSSDAIWRWFDLAHEWIVRGFTDLTGEYMHMQVWKRST